jgi:hypothetical protein
MFLVPLAVLAAGLLASWGDLASAAGTRAGGEVHIYLANAAADSDSPSDSYHTVILTGAINDYGVKGYRFVLTKGSFKVNDNAIIKKLIAIPVNPKTCVSAGTVRDPVPIVKGSGTGAYRGIRGVFQTTISTALIAPRLKNGKCNTSAKDYPAVFFARGAGTVSYK